VLEYLGIVVDVAKTVSQNNRSKQNKNYLKKQLTKPFET
jgi:hypothetical protein